MALDLETLKTQKGPLGEATEAKIREEAMRELDEEDKKRREDAGEDEGDDKGTKGEDKGGKTGAPDTETPEEKAAKEAKAKEETDAKAKKEADDKAAKEKAADEVILSKPEAELSEEEKTKKAEILKKQGAASDEEVKLYAAAEKITEEQAKEVLEGERKIVEKYEGNASKLARAYRHVQVLWKQAQDELKAVKEAGSAPLKENELIINDKRMTFDEAKPQMVEAYREAFPDKTAELTDGQVFDEAKRDYLLKVKTVMTDKREEMKKEATSKRAKLILDLPDSAKPFKADIEAILRTAPDGQVLHQDYNLEDIIFWAKGKNFEKIAKEREDAAYKRGLEKARILGEKNDAPESGGKGGGAGKTTKRVLSPAEKEEALRKFDGMNFMTDEQKYDAWAEVLEDEETKEKQKKKG